MDIVFLSLDEIAADFCHHNAFVDDNWRVGANPPLTF